MLNLKLWTTVALTCIWLGNSYGSDHEDDRIESIAAKSYTFKHELKKDHVKIEADAGVVTLSGKVNDRSHKMLAEETVLEIPGVKRVENKIEFKGDSVAENSDGWLFTQVKSALLFNRSVSSFTEVTVKDGLVTLRGQASSEAEKELTQEYALDVEGVKGVKNEMKVVASPSKKAKIEDVMDDASLTARVKYGMFAHRSTSGIKTHVETKNGVVTLTGKAKSLAEKDLVSKIVGDLNGVKKVNNEMSVE